MRVLGLNETHCATAALLSDGRIIGCASEERFTRLKNVAGYPRHAIDSVLRGAGLINRMIKKRDFWMPFAPTILSERAADYLVNPKGLSSPYMMLAFPTEPKRRDEIIATIHPHDGTTRAQSSRKPPIPTTIVSSENSSAEPESARFSTRHSTSTVSRLSARPTTRSTPSSEAVCPTARWGDG